MKIELAPPVTIDLPPNLAHELPESATRAKAAAGTFSLQRYQFASGKRAGVELLVVDSGKVRAAICPTRGLSLWRANMDGLDCSWQSPVEGPIHPHYVPIAEPNGLGWLDGFDELLVRCGLQSFGAPDFSANGQLKYPLHGRIGNLPATHWSVELDADHSLLEVRGEVHETRLLQFNLRLQVSYRFAFGQPTIDIVDVVRNAADTPTTMQMLYHVNVGAPLLEAGGTLHSAAKQIVARDAHAAKDLNSWPTYLQPTAGYVEQVYFSSPPANSLGWATSLLTSKDRSRGFAVHHQTKTLPYFSQWKNTVGSADGYVTGLEPGTGFPNPRSFEEEQGRVVPLDAGQSIEFHVRLEGVNQAERVQQLIADLETLRGGNAEMVAFNPMWCVPRN
jgi:galactose mutarotase-like enzyme